MKWSLVLLLSAGLMTAACGGSQRYDNVSGTLAYHGSGKIAVAAHDQRAYVISGKKEAKFVGIVRGGYGNPFDVPTATNRPLSTDAARAIANTLIKHGYTPVEVATEPGHASAVVMSALQKTRATRLLLLVLDEWKSDTYVGTAVHFDLKLRVFNAKGDLLAATTQKGQSDLGSSFFNAKGHAEKVTPIAFRKKLEALFGDPAITKALAGKR